MLAKEAAAAVVTVLANMLKCYHCALYNDAACYKRHIFPCRADTHTHTLSAGLSQSNIMSLRGGIASGCPKVQAKAVIHLMSNC